MGAVRNHEKKQLASFYFIACVKHRMGTGLLVFYSLEPTYIRKCVKAMNKPVFIRK